MDVGRLKFKRQEDLNLAEQGISMKEISTQLLIDTGMTAFYINQDSLDILSEVRSKANPGIQFKECCFSVVDRKGQKHRIKFPNWEVETSGPLRVTLKSESEVRSVCGLKVQCRLSFFANSGLIKTEVRLHNPQRAKHPGGIWDLGDRGSAFFRDFSFELIPQSNSCRCESRFLATIGNSEFSEADAVSIYQDSSGGANWRSQNHINAEGRVPCRFQGYRLIADGRDTTGLRAEPILNWRLPTSHVAFAMPEFWQQFPKTITATAEHFRIGLFPSEWDSLHELQGGEQKTHSFWLRFGEQSAESSDLSWVHNPVSIHLETDDCDRSKALPAINLPKSEPLSRYEAYLKESIQALLENREKVDEFGWRNYGEIFADHEQTYYKETEPLISHYNNQFDMVYGFLLSYLRTGDPCFWELGDALARACCGYRYLSYEK